MAACRCGCPAVRVFLQRLGSFGDKGPAVSSQGLAGNGAARGHRGCHLASVTAFVWNERTIKIVPSLVCTCSKVLAYGLLSPLFVILLLV